MSPCHVLRVFSLRQRPTSTTSVVWDHIQKPAQGPLQSPITSRLKVCKGSGWNCNTEQKSDEWNQSDQTIRRSIHRSEFTEKEQHSLYCFTVFVCGGPCHLSDSDSVVGPGSPLRAAGWFTDGGSLCYYLINTLKIKILTLNFFL